jgi:hypothetical protein
MYGFHFFSGTSTLLKKNVPRTVGANVGICFPNRTGERRERERDSGSKWPGPPPPSPLGSIYSGGGDGCLYFIPLARRDIISRSSILTTRSLKAIIKSLYL